MAAAHENTWKMRRGRAIGMFFVWMVSKQAPCAPYVSEHQHISHTHYSLAACTTLFAPPLKIPIPSSNKTLWKLQNTCVYLRLHDRWCAFHYTMPDAIEWRLGFFTVDALLHSQHWSEWANERVRERRATIRNVIAQKLIILAHRVHIYDTTSNDLFMYGIRRVSSKTMYCVGFHSGARGGCGKIRIELDFGEHRWGGGGWGERVHQLTLVYWFPAQFTTPRSRPAQDFL